MGVYYVSWVTQRDETRYFGYRRDCKGGPPVFLKFKSEGVGDVWGDWMTEGQGATPTGPFGRTVDRRKAGSKIEWT